MLIFLYQYYFFINLSIYFDAASRHPTLHWGALHIRNNCDDDYDYDEDDDDDDYNDDDDYKDYDECSLGLGCFVDWLKVLEEEKAERDRCPKLVEEAKWIWLSGLRESEWIRAEWKSYAVNGKLL